MIALGRLLTRHPNLQCGKFYDAIRELMRNELSDLFVDDGKIPTKAELVEIFKEDYPNIYAPGFYPDYYEIDSDNRKIIIYEVEDTHPLKHEKIARVVKFWFSVDNHLEYEVELFVTDRYGMNERKIPLPNLYFELYIGVPPGDEAAQRTARMMGIKLEDI